MRMCSFPRQALLLLFTAQVLLFWDIWYDRWMSLAQIERFSFHSGRKTLQRYNQALVSRGLSTLKASDLSGLAADYLVDAKFLAWQLSEIETLNRPMRKTKRYPSLGNLTAFNELRNAYFDTASEFEGVQLGVRVNSSGVTDVYLLHGGQPIPSYSSGNHRAATSVNLSQIVLNGREGFVYNERESSKLSNYTLVTTTKLNSHRHPKIAHVPKMCHKKAMNKSRPWLLEFSNVWMTGNGDIFVPVANSSRSAQNEWDVHAYQYQGGVCIADWSAIKGKRVVFRDHDMCSSRTKIGFSIAQNHGGTYYHVTNEVIPRLLTFWDVAMSVISVNGGKIAGPVSEVLSSMLRSFGVPGSNIMQIGFTQPCFFEKLFVPAPFLQDSYEHECLQRTTGRIIGDNVVRAASKPSTLTLAERRALPSRPKPVIALIDRALWRNAEGTVCRGRRCMANFPELRKAVETEFGDRIEVQVLSARDRDVMRRGIELFSTATVVVGMHGAGFSNLMYMRGAGTYAIHLGWKSMWQLYGKMAQKFRVDFVNILTRGASQDGENAVADISVVILEIRRSLEREGYTLDKPRIHTNPRRNSLVALRMPRTGSN